MNHEPKHNRRRFLTLVGSGVAAATTLSVAGCSSEQESPAPTDKLEDVAKQVDPKPEPAVTENKTDGLPALREDDAQAKALAYVEDASTVDQAKYPRYQEGQICANCALYQGSSDDPAGLCSIFAGKSVKAAGWCSVYAPKG